MLSLMSATATKLVVIIPALNEAATIGEVIGAIPEAIPGTDVIETIVIDDGSTDATHDVAAAAGARVVRHEKNMGVGAAFRTGLTEALRAGADYIVNIDGDGQFNPHDIPTLLQPILDQEVHFVTASRFARREWVPDMPAIKIWGNRWMTRIINFITRQHFTDVSCGFRAYSREAALRLSLFGNFTYTQETFIDLAYKNIAMAEVPLKIKGEREHGRSRVADNLWRYGLKSATIVFRAARDYQPQYFFGIPGMIIFAAGLICGLWLLQHLLRTGHTFPYRSLVQVSGVLIIVGFLMLFLSLLADMLHRNRLIAEEAVYHARRAAYAKSAHHPRV